MSDSGCCWGRDRIYRIIFARGIVSRCDGLNEPIISAGLYSIWVLRGASDWGLS